MDQMITYTVKVDEDKNKYWYLNGKPHREDGPAVEYANGDKSWWLNGKRHREDGPAVEHADGDKRWHIDGEELTEAEFNDRKNKTIVLDGITYKLVKQ